MPRHTADLQALINFWHTQDVMHALTAAHPWLLLQLPRFRWVRGRSQKGRQHYTLATSLQVPVYANSTDLTVHWLHYRVVSYIQHHGSQPDRGHYTVIQMGSEGAGASWLIDDEKDPQSLDDSMRTHAAQNMYVVS